MADGNDGSLTMHQDASIYRLRLSKAEAQSISTANRSGYLHVITGTSEVQQPDTSVQLMSAGDGSGVGPNSTFSIVAESAELEALWFDLPDQGNF